MYVEPILGERQRQQAEMGRGGRRERKETEHEGEMIGRASVFVGEKKEEGIGGKKEKERWRGGQRGVKECVCVCVCVQYV